MKHGNNARIPVLKIRVEPQTIRVLEGEIGSPAVFLSLEEGVLRLRPVQCSQDHLIFPRCQQCKNFPEGCRKLTKISHGYGEEVILYAEDIVSKIGMNSWSTPRIFTAHWDGQSSYVAFIGGR
jgi:hypothetical protein